MNAGSIILAQQWEIISPDTGSGARTASIGYTGALTAVANAQDMKTAAFHNSVTPVAAATDLDFIFTAIEAPTNLVIGAYLVVAPINRFNRVP